ncbi:alpha-ribazole phosphatase [Paraburkholderia unamae]|uniref:Alpha-ribazole phosphatase n=1 Tax=Paraburkholderia unamae TaxID=219649 RepID=A0ABX5KKJ1_9BURK|nr:alpha-ribazole phosphatase [Paraburkholderia unamae]PVX82372.1 alpha-ribazole phosphatase [Paraburkholderia unamae]CAG9248688.1 Alpha-ribazole-5'-phosphate phosphatase [Paraburkholderia unamae]
MDLVLIRHPAVAVEAGVCYGASDVPLAGEANEQAALLATRLMALGVRAPQRIATSPLTRCASVAAALSAAHGHTPAADARLAEMDFGAWERQRWDEIDRAQIDAWAADFEHARMHGGESVAQFDARVSAWFATLDAHEKTTVWAVTHAGVIRTVTARALGMPLARCVRWPLEMAAVVWLRYDASSAQWLLSRWNA